MRVITGAKKDLRQLVAEGKFREDLSHRLNVVPILLPPLRERRKTSCCSPTTSCGGRFARAEMEPRPLSALARHALLSYDWPGNVRELRERVRAHRADVPMR